MITVNVPIPYDLYINASGLENKEHFVRIKPKGEIITSHDLENFRSKYRQLYIPESQRSDYLKSVCQGSGKNLEEKATVIKDTAIKYLDNLFNPTREFTTEVLGESIQGCRDVVSNMVDLIHTCDIDALREMIGKLSFHDFYTYDHSINVSMYSILLFQYLNPNASKTQVIEAGLGGLLHDLGKIKIPTHIINKSGKLTDDEFTQIKNHPGFGRDLMMSEGLALPQGVDAANLRRTIFEHHENFNGTGYPSKIAGENIHIYARITAIADFFDAITTKRSYHEPLSIKDALALMAKSTGAKLDPRLFDAFSKHTCHFHKEHHSNLKLGDDFDPCQPHNKLPLSAGLDLKKPTYGGIKIIGKESSLGDWAKKDNVRVIDPRLDKPKTIKRTGSK